MCIFVNFNSLLYHVSLQIAHCHVMKEQSCATVLVPVIAASVMMMISV